MFFENLLFIKEFSIIFMVLYVVLQVQRTPLAQHILLQRMTNEVLVARGSGTNY